MAKRALITGITGQDGSYLAEFLLDKGYDVFGFMRRSSTEPLLRIEHLVLNKRISLINGNLRDIAAIERAVKESRPDEIYNLAAQSDVGISFVCPEETWEINYHGVGRLVHAAMKFSPKAKIYQASTSEMFGSTLPPQNEQSPFRPVSPYAEAKLGAYQDYVLGYREKHGLFFYSGILYNHESPRRGKHFVTRKITHSLAKIFLKAQDCLELGNLAAVRDWGYAKEYVEAMWLMLQQEQPDDFVIATGQGHTVKEFVDLAAQALEMKIFWYGEGQEMVGLDNDRKVIVKINPKFYRPNEVDELIGDSSKAKKAFGWQSRTSLETLAAIMARNDLRLALSQR